MVEIYHESPDHKVVIGWLLLLKGHSTSRVTAFLASEKGDSFSTRLHIVESTAFILATAECNIF